MQDAFMHCEALLRAGDKERFLAALFAPAEHRAAIFALCAFNLEIARVREAARGPLAGEIRLQWWSDVLGTERPDQLEGHPVAAALLATIAKHRLERKPLQALIDARRFDLYDEPMRTLADLETYANAGAVNLIALCAQILDDGRQPDIGELSRHAGVAHAIAGLLNAFPAHVRRGQLYVPLELLERHGSGWQEVMSKHASAGLRSALGELRLIARRHLAQASARMRNAPAAVLPAFLPVALAPVILARMERKDYDPFVPVEIAPWRRQWLIWRAARRPARIFE
jgi:phytoene synthase